jgi:hypothetical protein
MRPMKRKQIYIAPDQDRRLRALSRRQGKTESQLIREGIDRVLNTPLPGPLDHEAWLESLKFIDSLIRKGPIKGKRTWKREDLYERR